MDQRALAPVFQKLRAEGTKLFLVTNSNYDYAGLLMNQAFGADWRDLFELIVYRANKKRGFFAGDGPFLRYDGDGQDGTAVDRLAPAAELGTKEFCEGNSTELRRFLGSDRVAYVGDDLWGDVHLTRRYTPEWAAVGIVEELVDTQAGGSVPGVPSKSWGSVFHASHGGAFTRLATLCAGAHAIVPSLISLLSAPASSTERELPQLGAGVRDEVDLVAQMRFGDGDADGASEGRKQ